MGLYEECNATREMYWFGPSEAAYDSGCDQSPIMHPDHPQFPQHPIDSSNTPHSEQPPLTPSSSTSSLSGSSASSHLPFVSPGSDRSHYVSPSSVETETPNLRSPCPRTTSSGPQDLTSSSIHVTSSSTVRHATTSITTNSGEISFCAGCSDRIIDRFYLLAVERRWHAGCLRCTVCRLPLDTAATCFAKDGNIFCKDDYQRLFSIRRCARCGQGVSSAELVMRARDLVYHVQCFTCAQCNTQLTKGDHFGMNGSMIYCRDHYQIPNAMEGGHISPCGMPTGPYPPGTILPQGPPTNQIPLPHLPPEGMQGYPPPESMGKLQFFNSVGAPHKGRPRKRKPKEEPMDTNMNLSNGYEMDVYGPLGGSCQPVRTKRVRTSFKHNQLRTMKSYFGVNHNPDAKDLKQLSQKTGLSKRVLQVWFQNARAKWRRQVITKDPKSLGTPGEAGTTSCQDGLDGSGPDCGPDYGASPPSCEPPMSPDEEESSVGSNGTHLPYSQQMF